jgi:hypothetical protein
LQIRLGVAGRILPYLQIFLGLNGLLKANAPAYFDASSMRGKKFYDSRKQHYSLSYNFFSLEEREIILEYLSLPNFFSLV